jgi:hypothetical protein
MHPIELVKGLVSGGVKAGVPLSHGPLALVPLFGGAKAPTYVLGAEAIESGVVAVEEIGGGEVPNLVVKNLGDRPVLLVEGEHLQGAKQDRVLNLSVLAAPHHDTVIPVSCLEQGRWGYAGGHRFAPGAEFSYVALRAQKLRAVAASVRLQGSRRSDQGEIWAEIERKRAEIGGGPSQTRSMRDAYASREADLSAMVEAFPEPRSGQTGVVVCGGGRPLAIDAFDRPGTLTKLWPRLVRGYAMGALGAPVRGVDEGVIERFLAHVTEADATSHEGVGLGIDVLITSSDLVASALVWEHAVVHLAVFASVHARRDALRPAASNLKGTQTADHRLEHGVRTGRG